MWLRFSALLLFSFELAFLTGCFSKKPEPIDFGADSCQNCKMVITDRRFGGEIVSAKGKIYQFDALECLHQFQLEHSDLVGVQSGAKVYVIDSSKNGELILAEDAQFRVETKLRSPMGQAIYAVPKSRVLSTTEPVFSWLDIQTKLERPSR